MSQDQKQKGPGGGQDEHQQGQIEVKVLGQEGDEKEVKVNPHQDCAHLLHKGLQALYGNPGPAPDQYNLVFHGSVLEPLSQTIAAAGITSGVTVSIQPKSISRGAAGVAQCRL